MAGTELRFETERTRAFRARELSNADAHTLDHIEQFGCSIVSVDRTGAGPGWYYTTGVYDTAGAPEIITVGLKPDTAHYLLNEASDRLREGVDLTQGRHRDMIGEVECEFRPMDPKWVKHLMGWRFGTTMEPLFPCCRRSPDRENRFPEEDGFDARFVQPL